VRGRLRVKTEEILDALEEPLSERHLWLLRSIDRQINALEQEIIEIDDYLAEQMLPYKAQIELLQTIPGIDFITAVALLVEIGP